MEIIVVAKILFVLILFSLASLPCSVLSGINYSLSSSRQPSISANIRNSSNQSFRPLNTLQTSEIGKSSSNSSVAPTSIKQKKIVSSMHDYLHRAINKSSKTQTFHKPVKTENFNSESLKTSPSITIIQSPTPLDRDKIDKDTTPMYVKDSPTFYNKDIPTFFVKDTPFIYVKDTPPIYAKNKEKATTTNSAPTYTKDKDEKLFSIPFQILIPKPTRPQCSKGMSCKGRCGFQRQFGDKWSCFCDPDCNMLFEDCCEDFDEYCNTTFMQEHKVINEFEKRWNCTTLYHDDSPIWVIGQCQPGWNDVDVLRRCTEKNTKSKIISQLIPVIDQYHNTFLNRYCAICNNVTSFSQWEFEVYCDVIPPAGYTEAQWATFLDLFCIKDSFTLKQTWGKRYCVIVHSDCSYKDSEEAVKGCRFGPTGLITHLSKNIHYRNWDCLLCNSLIYAMLPPFPVCGPRPPMSKYQSFTWSKIVPYSAIFRASSLPIPQCPQEQLYDDTFGECKPFLSRNDLNVGEVLKRYVVILEYKEHSNSCGISLSTGSESANLMMMRLGDVFPKLLGISLMERDSRLVDFKIQPLDNSSYRVIFQLLENSEENDLVESIIGHELKLQNLAFHSRSFTRSRGLCTYYINTCIVHKMICAENETFSVNEIEIYANNSAFIIKTGKLYSDKEYFVFKNEKRLALCKDYWPGNCSYYIEVKNESNWSLFENGSVHTDVTKAPWLHYGEYTIVDGVLRFCSRFPNAIFSTTTSIHETVLSYATIVCLSMSIISLAALLIVYLLFPALRNIPGKNLMLFSGILASSQVLWLLQQYIASLSSTLCVATAFALQYFLLASFSCSTSIAFHSFLTFLNIAKGKLTQSSGKTFLHYVLYSLGFPLLLLLMCWLLYYHNLLTIVHYQHVCWFKHDLSIYIAFHIPAFTMLLLNFILLSKTMMFLRDCTKERRNLAGKTGAPTRIQIGIYLRLSTIMGATWLFGVFIVIFPDVVALEYLFVFIDGLQGLYVALAFLFTDNVKKFIIRRKDRGATTGKSNAMHSTLASTTM
ncbi:Cadherin EGF LAG seven-pass G-type receptor 1 [Paramuricea clavata]|uniref:Cadherin EGF LAG seven-pass G-type receptor 1 n=1 Tax=Paramuricea clavata TaxID=317549 RepID=A0A7D9I8Q3_PARCT|nr:Cadherin EGF LAG seven-pass G-type receptor 1 [Paramuricea clavata]